MNCTIQKTLYSRIYHIKYTYAFLNMKKIYFKMYYSKYTRCISNCSFHNTKFSNCNFHNTILKGKADFQIIWRCSVNLWRCKSYRFYDPSDKNLPRSTGEEKANSEKPFPTETINMAVSQCSSKVILRHNGINVCQL